FQTYLPKIAEDTFDPQLLTGDQVSVERAVNVIESVSNGFSAEECLEGFNLQIDDWHAAVKILTQIFKHYYNCKSESDTCTLYSDRTLINRRNVKEDPKTAYRADRYFFVLVVKSRIIAGAMKVVGINDKCSSPTEFPMPEDMAKASKEQKLHYLHKAAAKIIDELVLEESTGINDICNQIILTQEQEDKKPAATNLQWLISL
ncbi:uncharacterized protein LOC116305066, partial [Actinia tenebrosa]|uniref:Uncharacterized protein LOC116305066 n=1 Tax=Actinia tenebrosa TaxID=6105 RepID=A0A6P8IY03_ACTTE